MRPRTIELLSVDILFMSRGNEHVGVETFKLQAKRLKEKSEKGDINGLQRWVNSEIKVMIFGSYHALSIFIVLGTWVSSPGYNAVLITSAYFLFNLLLMIIKYRKHKELKIIRDQQVDELRKKTSHGLLNIN